jgi:hypothetical protein
MLDYNDAPLQRNWDTVDLSAHKDDIRRRLLENLKPLLSWVFPNGTCQGRKFYIGNLQGDAGDSMEIELEGDKAGVGYDHATGESGDVFDFIAQREGLDIRREFRQVLIAAERWLRGDGLALAIPLDLKAQSAANDDDLGAHTAKWDYQSADGHLLTCIYRFDPPSGKTFRARDIVRGIKAMPPVRPLYNLRGIAQSDQIILVEGEKCAQALIDQGLCATTLMGGANTPIKKTDLSPLSGKQVLVWPDKDQAGRDYAERIARALLEAGARSCDILAPPADRPDKWDAADAIAEGFDWRTWLQQGQRSPVDDSSAFISIYDAAAMLADDSTAPADWIGPHLLDQGGMLVLGGPPKVGKSDFLLSLLAHLAAGLPFLGLQPPRPLRVFYLQSEIRYYYLRERLKALRLPPACLTVMGDNLKLTAQLRMILDEEGLEKVIRSMRRTYASDKPDIIVIDPIRNLFDGGEHGGENDNNAMLFFLQQRVETLRDAINPDAGLVLVHHTRKLAKKQFLEDPFQAFSGAGSLRSFYTSGLLLHKQDESLSTRELYFELRNGPAIATKHVDKIHGAWREVLPDQRLIQPEYGHRLNAERLRKKDVILGLLFDEAREGHCYTGNQFAETFEGQGGLGADRTIRDRLSVLATKGYIKFFRNPMSYGLSAAARSRWGYLCVEGMVLRLPGPVDGETGEIQFTEQIVLPTHYKCPQTGAMLPVENPTMWVYQEDQDENE